MELSRDDLVLRCGIRDRTDPGYVPTECILHFVRACRRDNSSAYFERLYKTLAERVARALPKVEAASSQVSLKNTKIHEKARDRFVELLMLDRKKYDERLDYFEVKFNDALARLRQDAQKVAWREENRSVPLEKDDGSLELSPEVEAAAGVFDPFAATNASENYRSGLDAAIDVLPEEQMRIVEMLRLQIPIDSKDPNAITIAKTLGKSEKTIRTYRDKAFETLRKALREEEGEE